MARQNMQVSPIHKHMHAYQNFSGGINSMDTDEKISDTELAELVNADIGERGSLERRSGFERHFVGNWTKWSDIGHLKWSEL